LQLNFRSTGFMRPIVLRLFISAAAVWLSAASLALSAASVAQEPDSAMIAAQIRSVLHAQQEAWNRGDVNGFMNGYARSKSIIFVSEDTVARGCKTVHDRYQKKYSDRAKMGVLTFSSVEITPLSNDAAVALGRWKLKRAQDQPRGRFTLIFRKTADGWRIVHDHTSTAASPR
jgi:ketosteroid isomerase-like protein